MCSDLYTEQLIYHYLNCEGVKRYQLFGLQIWMTMMYKTTLSNNFFALACCSGLVVGPAMRGHAVYFVCTQIHLRVKKITPIFAAFLIWHVFSNSGGLECFCGHCNWNKPLITDNRLGKDIFPCLLFYGIIITIFGFLNICYCPQ